MIAVSEKDLNARLNVAWHEGAVAGMQNMREFTLWLRGDQEGDPPALVDSPYGGEDEKS